MELTLNLIWVCVAIVGILVQIVMLSRASAERRESPWRKAVAMGCALVILFFVISMTDDLHNQTLVFEESKLSRIAPAARVSSYSISHRLIVPDFAALIAPANVSPPPPAWSRLTVHPDFLFTPAVVREMVFGRAPPLFPA